MTLLRGDISPYLLILLLPAYRKARLGLAYIAICNGLIVKEAHSIEQKMLTAGQIV